ncbi:MULTISPECIES: pentapeptide repeat-containing protein [Trichocoleus]|uniref:Pentapeptide repeat-containing protein n=1 Tax=Trichocoleus desertorum GB2-A4 TaxID=2933944 RepID=A0ABV0JEY9_9CYAN|nr:pentapeptide repeat-containing protein [Trichocoleus sp. FACHB-46]MBD1864293.1 pentapeptide repeat-containing protein [Trichocoleus sp. FACHB-46]
MGTEQVGSLLATAAIIFLLVLVAVGLGAFNIPFPEEQLDKRVNTIIESLKVTATLFGGFAVLINAYYAAKRAEAMDKTAIAAEKNIEIGLKNVEIGLKNAELTEERLITERFTKAIEQLGSSEMEIRLGGIYALERIANDSTKDYWQVIEVLTAYIRERAPWPPTKSSKQRKLVKPILNKAPTDIQAVLTVLGRRKHSHGDPEELHPIDLGATDLRGVTLAAGARLQGVNFYQANLQGAKLIKVNLQEAILMEADLQEAYLNEAELQRATLIKANLRKAGIFNTKFLGADLREAKLEEAIFRNVDFQAANLVKANCQRASIRGSNLQEANLMEANLQEADFLTSNFRKAFLQGANLEGAKLDGADLRGAFLSEARLQGAFLQQANLEGVIGLENAYGLTLEQLTLTNVNQDVQSPEISTIE